MGKIRKYRQKFLNLNKKSKSLSNLSEVEEESRGSKNLSLLPQEENIFAGINISLDNLNKFPSEDFDVRSVISTKSRKELKEEERHLKKEEKLRLRHERFIKKLNITSQLIKNSKLKKKNQKKNLGVNMSSLLNALPSLQSLEVDSLKASLEKPKANPKGILKTKQRLKQQAIDVEIFKHILDDKTFKENPLQAISQYLRQKEEGLKNELNYHARLSVQMFKYCNI